MLIDGDQRTANERMLLNKQDFIVKHGYSVLFKVGEGGFGSVFLGQEPQAGGMADIDVAIKLVTPLLRRGVIKNVKRRTRSAAGACNSVVHVYDSEEASEELQFCMREVFFLNTIQKNHLPIR